MPMFAKFLPPTADPSGHPDMITVLDTGLPWTGGPFLAMDQHDRGPLAGAFGGRGMPLATPLRRILPAERPARRRRQTVRACGGTSVRPWTAGAAATPPGTRGLP
jgi:hypothetical protein